jgi:hypothetical protein
MISLLLLQKDAINVIDYLFLKFGYFDLKQIKCKNCIDKNEII